MSKLVEGLTAALLVCELAFAPPAAAAEADADKLKLQQATAACKAQTKEYTKYHETSWWQRHKMVQKCVKDTLAKQ
jgi:hypothetical protein